MRTKTIRTLAMTVAMTGSLWLAAGAATAQKLPQGRLKICKVAGLGVAVGTPFTFHADSQSVTVPAGPAPDGSCVLVGPTFTVGSVIPVTEILTNGNQVTGIVVDPPNRLVPWSVNLPGGTVNVQIGTGVTVVTFANKRTGYLEICKQTKPPGGTGSYTFYVNPGWLGPYTVQAGTCTRPIEVAAGTVIIYEVLGWGVQLVGCSVIIGGPQVIPCITSAGLYAVNVAPGDVSTETAVLMINASIHPDPTTPTENPADLTNPTEQR